MSIEENVKTCPNCNVGLNFYLLIDGKLECRNCGIVFGFWSESRKPIAKVVNNNQPGWTNIIETGWTNIIETEPNVTLDIGTKLYSSR